MVLFKELSNADAAKVYFFYANHSNPIFDPKSREFKEVEKLGFHVAQPEYNFRFI